MNRVVLGGQGILVCRFAWLGLVAALGCLPSTASAQAEQELAQTEDEEPGVMDWLLDRYDPNPYDAYGFEYPYTMDSPPEGRYHEPHDWAWKSDHQLKADVRKQLRWNPFVDEDDIDVSVREGAVTLNGTVGDQEELKDAIADAYDAGAKEVISRLHTRTDE